MPRNTVLEKLEKPKSAAATLIFAMNRYFQNRGTEIFSSELGEGSYGGGQLELMLALLEDYSLNGLYTRRVTERRLNSGKADWSRTISRGNPFPSSNGPFYLDIYGTHRRYLSECEIARIHAAVVRKLDPILGWVVTGGGSLMDDKLLGTPEPSGDIESQIASLEKSYSSAYSDRDIFIIGSLLRYLREQRGNDLSSQVVGLRNFHGMWEGMLDACLNFTLKVNQQLAVPVYKIKGVYHKAPRKGQRTDTVLKSPNQKVYTVVDAKYYGATGLGSVPGWPDLVKQFYYAKALVQLYPGAVIHNAFIFPGNERIVEAVHMAKRGKGEISEDDLLNDDYPPIRCVYQDPLELLEYYVAGRKLSSLSLDLLSLEEKSEQVT